MNRRTALAVMAGSLGFCQATSARSSVLPTTAGATAQNHCRHLLNTVDRFLSTAVCVAVAQPAVEVCQQLRQKLAGGQQPAAAQIQVAADFCQQAVERMSVDSRTKSVVEQEVRQLQAAGQAVILSGSRV